MKRTLLIAILCVVSMTFMEAQLSNHGKTATEFKNLKAALIDEARTEVGVPGNFGVLRGEERQLGSSFNIYSILLDGQNQTYYHPELNSLTFIHRQNSDAPVGGSGVISYDYSTDGGDNWEVDNKPVTPNILNGNRYPSGTIYNPPGNTDPANAYFVGVGPALHEDPVNGNGWGYEFVTSSPLLYDGTNIGEDYYTNDDETSFHPYSLVSQPNGDIWYVSTRWDSDADPNQEDPTHTYSEFLLCKLSFNSSTNTFDRTIEEVFEPNLDGLVDPVIGGDYQLAFSPDGMTGYFAYVCSDIDNTAGTGTGVKPVLWKTTDAGDTWTKHTNVDYTAMQELLDNTYDADDGSQIPYMSSFDMVVDGDGNANLIAQMYSRSVPGLDSMGWGFFGGDSAATVFHFITDGDIWTSSFVDWWGNDTGEGAVGAVNTFIRPQATRTADGKFVAGTYLKTCTDGTGCAEFSGPLLAPEIYGFGYDVEEANHTDVKWITSIDEGLFLGGKYFFQTMSPVCIKDGADKFIELPICFANPGDDDLSPPNYFYLKGVGFTADDFEIEINTEEPVLDAGLVDVFPNPTAGNLTIDLSELSSNATITLTDATGRLVVQNTDQAGVVRMNISALATGVYNMNIQVTEGVLNKKVVLTK